MQSAAADSESKRTCRQCLGEGWRLSDLLTEAVLSTTRVLASPVGRLRFRLGGPGAGLSTRSRVAAALSRAVTPSATRSSCASSQDASRPPGNPPVARRSSAPRAFPVARAGPRENPRDTVLALTPVAAVTSLMLATIDPSRRWISERCSLRRWRGRRLKSCQRHRSAGTRSAPRCRRQ